MKVLNTVCSTVFFLLFVIQGCSATPSQPQTGDVIERGNALPPSAYPPRQPDSSQPGYTVANANQPPAVVALIKQAEGQANAGELDSAAASLERAIRIDPRNALLWYHLATVRLSQENPAQAEQLASKSNSLAPGNYAQQSRGWLLIAAARRQMNNASGAAHAEQRARELAAQ